MKVTIRSSTSLRTTETRIRDSRTVLVQSMVYVMSVLFILLLIPRTQVNAQQPELLNVFNSVNAVNGDEVEFNCVAVEASLIVFFVNGTSASDQIVVNKGFMQQLTEDLNDTTIRRTLTATAMTKYNNTEVYCIAWNFVGIELFTVVSETAILLVQDRLSAVVVRYKFVDSSSLNISWNPPFTLPETHITGYNISVTSIMFNISEFITDTYYVLTAPNNTDPCDEISITVAGYNGAGNGEKTTISSLYFQTVPSDDFNIPVTIPPVVTGNNIFLPVTLQVDVSELCPGEYPTTIDILITDSTDDTTIQNINDVMLMEGSQDHVLTTVDTITLQSDMIYTIQVSFSNLDGKFNITSSTNFKLLTIGWKFDGSGYVEYQTQFYRSIRRIVLKTSFHPQDNAGLLLFASQYSNGSGSYILLQMREQSVEFGMSTGNHKILLRTSVVDLNVWHTIKVTYLSSVNYVFLEIDGNLVDLGLLEDIQGTQTHSNSYVKLSSGFLYIGNIPNSLTDYPQVAVVKGFNGCIDTFDFDIDGHYTVEGATQFENVEKCFIPL